MAGGRTVSAGARPAVVLRGYGEDEPAVHRALNPQLTVIVDADRPQAWRGRRPQGPTWRCSTTRSNIVACDALADVVLVSAEQWEQSHHCFPPARWREPLGALRRATLSVTRKSTCRRAAVSPWRTRCVGPPDVPVGVVHLALERARRADGTERGHALRSPARGCWRSPASATRTAFGAQLEQAGARATACIPRPPSYSAADAARFWPAAPARSCRLHTQGRREVGAALASRRFAIMVCLSAPRAGRRRRCLARPCSAARAMRASPTLDCPIRHASYP